jgi:MFS family permease
MNTVYPGLFIVRILICFSMKAPMTAPLCADYITSNTRGKAVAFSGIGAGFGAIFAVFVLFGISMHMSFKASFFVAAGCYLAFAFYMLFTIKDVHQRQREESYVSSFFSWTRLKKTTQDLWKISRTSREINLSYYGSFVTRMGDVLTILFMNIWIASFYGKTEDDIKQANSKSQMISGIGGVLILI